jgi:hypothetical protein
MQTQTTKNEKAHPYEIAGMGTGPYQFCGIVEMPDLSSDSASNFANPDPYAEINAIGLKAGAGTCACCGMAITVICVVMDGQGDKWGVGSDCIQKIGCPSLCDAAKIAVAKRRRAKDAARNEKRRIAAHQVWLNKPCARLDAIKGETNLEYNQRQDRALKAKQLERAQILSRRAETFREEITILALPIDRGGSSFHRSLADALAVGELTERQADYACKFILGARRSKKNAEKYDALFRKLRGLPAQEPELA